MSVGCSLNRCCIGDKGAISKCTEDVQAGLDCLNSGAYDSILQSDSRFSEWCGGTLFPLSSQHAPAAPNYPHSSPILLLPLPLPTTTLLLPYLLLPILLPFPVTMPTTLHLPSYLFLPSYPYSSPPTSTSPLLPLLLPSYPYSSYT